MPKICIICARGGSKGVPRKNVREIAGHPLVAHSIMHAQESDLFDQIVVSSDDDEILEIAARYGAETVQRGDDLSNDTAGTMPAVKHALEQAEARFETEYDTVVLLQPTSPIRLPSDIIGAVYWMEESGASSVLSVKKTKGEPYFTMIEKQEAGGYVLCKKSDALRRQDTPDVYEINGSIYVWRREIVMDDKPSLGAQTEIFVMPEERSLDIDTPLDWDIVEYFMTR